MQSTISFNMSGETLAQLENLKGSYSRGQVARALVVAALKAGLKPDFTKISPSENALLARIAQLEEQMKSIATTR